MGYGKGVNLNANPDKMGDARYYFSGDIDTKYYTEEFEKKLIEGVREVRGFFELEGRVFVEKYKV